MHPQLYSKNTHIHTHTVLPDAPELESISISTNSLMIQVTISDVGTPPILALVVEFNAPEIFTRNFTAAPYLPRITYNLEVTGLQDNTQYSFTVSSVNYQGRGRATTRYNSTTGEWRCSLSVRERGRGRGREREREREREGGLFCVEGVGLGGRSSSFNTNSEAKAQKGTFSPLGLHFSTVVGKRFAYVP